MIVFYKDGHWEHKDFGSKLRGHVHNGKRPHLLLLTADELLWAIETFGRRYEELGEKKIVEYMLHHLTPAIEGHIICQWGFRMHILEVKYQIIGCLNEIKTKLKRL